jgi:hypothetical protein
MLIMRRLLHMIAACIILASLTAVVLSPDAFAGESWMRGKWKSKMSRLNLSGYFFVGVDIKTDKVFGLSGNWGPLPRNTDFMRPEDETVETSHVRSSSTSLSFDFESWQIKRRAGSETKRGKSRKAVVRTGHIVLNRNAQGDLQGRVKFSDGSEDTILLTKD